MSALTEPSRVPIHSPTMGTSFWTTGTTSTATGGGGDACLRAQAAARRVAKSATGRRKDMATSGGALAAEPHGGHDGQDDENGEDDSRRDDERRLRLPGRERVEGRNLEERLHHAHEHVQVERDHRRDHVDAAPCPAQVEAVAGAESDGEHDERGRPDDVGAHAMLDRAAEPGHAPGARGAPAPGA